MNCPGRWWHCPHLVLILLATRDKVNRTTASYREREARGRRRKAGRLDEIWMVDRMVELCKVLRVLAVALGPVLTKWLTQGTRVERRRRHDSRGPRLRHGSQGDANPGTNLNVPRELVQITADKKCMRNNRTRDNICLLYEHPFKSDAPNLTHAWKNDPRNASCVFRSSGARSRPRGRHATLADRGRGVPYPPLVTFGPLAE